MAKALKRDQVPIEETWNLEDIFPTEEEYEAALKKTLDRAKTFREDYRGKIKAAGDVVEALKAYEALLMDLDDLSNYVSLHEEADTRNPVHMARSQRFTDLMAGLEQDLSFLEPDLAALSKEVLEEAGTKDPSYANYLDKMVRKKDHLLSDKEEGILAAMGPVLDSPYQVYGDIKQGDIRFPAFEVDGEEVHMTYNAFENSLETSANTALRRKASQVFYDQLDKYKSGTASAYLTQVRREKIEASLRGYDSVFDYLLDRQDVDRDLYNRQIDVIMRDLAPVMQKYARYLKDLYGLEEMTSFDLKAPPTSGESEEISFQEAGEYIKDGLSLLGPDYVAMLDRAFKERWIDYAENEGKSTGAFCASSYNVHPYILTSFNRQINEVITLSHELGHAGQDILTNKNQNILNTYLSMYFVEAPSTANEIIMGNYLLKKAGEDKEVKKEIMGQIISQTYYHNFVTHLLEAAYQREVYRIIDEGGAFDADRLSEIYRKVLT
ncbi:M3 family metallopeptidase, partial [Kallipyga massiliensis]|uniref:M3 family metallopeptidase n=1 Tax=Kallipyga massiliensis TaxID=1472764 RepID=UPI0026F375D9